MENSNLLEEHKIAGMGWRTLAFFADSILISMLVYLFVRYCFGDEVTTVLNEFENLSKQMSDATIAGDANAMKNLEPEAAKFAQSHAMQTVLNALTYGSATIAFAYFFIGEFFFAGTSIGKRIVRIKTISTNGEKMNFIQCLLRAIWKALTFAPINFIVLIIVIINAYVPFFNKQNRGWHDKTAGTLVVNS